MSSLKRLRRGLLIVCLLAITAGVAGCGGDEEGASAAAETPAADSGTSPSTAESTAPPATAPKRPARRKDRQEERDRKRRQREKQSSPTETKPESRPETTSETPPPEPEPEADREPEPTTPKRSAPPAEDETRVLHIVERATLKLVKREGVTYWQEGTVKGTLTGTIEVRVTIGGPGVISTFTVTLRDGTVRGRGEASVRPDGSVVHYDGTATITGGTGEYAGASGRNLRYTGTGAADGSKATARLSGKVQY